MRIIFKALSVLFLCQLTSCSSTVFQLEVHESGCYNIISGHDLIDNSQDTVYLKIPITISSAKKRKTYLEVQAEDMLGNSISISNNYYQIFTEKRKTSIDTSLHLNLPNGFYRLKISAINGQHTAIAYTEIGIVPPTASGLRPNSLFASNTSDIKTGKDLNLLNLVGIKVQRTHFYPAIRNIPPEGQNTALEFDYDSLDNLLNGSVKKGIWVLPIAGYAFPGTKSERAVAMNMHGPPRHFGEFTQSWKEIISNYSNINVYELWNEPWIYEWTWAANAKDYRNLQQLWCGEILKSAPNTRIIAGNSCMFVEDNIEPYPEIWKGLIHGTSHHPYANAEARSLRHNAQIRSIDYGYLVNRRMGLPYYYLTEGGTLYSLPSNIADQTKHDRIGSGINNNPNASKAVQYTIAAALHGCYQSNIQWNLGFGPGWTRSNTTLAVCSYFLEDKVIVADIWPGNSLITGAIFADPAHIDSKVKNLPRADELSARWKVLVPEEAIHRDLKVAVIYSLTGSEPDAIDTNGTLRITRDFRKIRAFDCTGREITGTEEYLEVPLSEYPVYLVTESSGIYSFYQALANAEIENITAVNMYANSITTPPDTHPIIHIRIDNHLNHALKGKIEITNTDSIVGMADINLLQGLNELSIPLKQIRGDENGMFPVKLSLYTDEGTYERNQLIQRALFTRGSRVIDGKLDDWRGSNPVTIDSEALKGGVDLTRYLLNPNLEKPKDDATSKSRVAGRIYTSYDNNFIYLAAEIYEDTLMNEAGKPALKSGIETGYNLGLPGGLTHPRYTGDCLQFGFGFRERVTGFGRQPGDPLEWKGHFYDTDYLYLAYTSRKGDQLIRQWGPDTKRLNGFQTDPVAHIAEIPGSEIKIVRDEQQRISFYEIAIPREEISLFTEEENHLRFGFIIANNEGAGTSGKLAWAEAVGVYDYWLNTGSFAPTWDQNLPCQTYFGIAK